MNISFPKEHNLNNCSTIRPCILRFGYCPCPTERGWQNDQSDKFTHISTNVIINNSTCSLVLKKQIHRLLYFRQFFNIKTGTIHTIKLVCLQYFEPWMGRVNSGTQLIPYLGSSCSVFWAYHRQVTLPWQHAGCWHTCWRSTARCSHVLGQHLHLWLHCEPKTKEFMSLIFYT